MPELLFNLRSVPDDEAAEVRELLTEGGIDFYETTAGRWGISQPAIWLRDTTQLLEAKALLEEYQRQRYHQAQLDRSDESLITRLLRSPVRTLCYVAAISFVLYLTVLPFLAL